MQPEFDESMRYQTLWKSKLFDTEQAD